METEEQLMLVQCNAMQFNSIQCYGMLKGLYVSYGEIIQTEIKSLTNGITKCEICASTHTNYNFNKFRKFAETLFFKSAAEPNEKKELDHRRQKVL